MVPDSKKDPPPPPCNIHELWQAMHEKQHVLEARALTIAEEANRKALEIASKEIDRRLEGMNELRAQITQERGQYLLRDFYDEQHAALRDQLDLRIKALENSRSNLEGRMWAIGIVLSVFVVIVNLLLRYWGK